MTTPSPIDSNHIGIGRIIMGQRKGQMMTLDLTDVKRHVGVFGGSGSGKSWALKVLVEAMLARAIPSLCIDTKGDITALALPAGSPKDYERYDLPIPAPAPSEEDWTLGSQIAKLLRERVHVRVLTPCSSVGEQLAIVPLSSRPDAYQQLLAADGGSEDLVLQADAQASNFLARVGVKIDRRASAPPSYDLGRATETLLQCWKENVDLSGLDGLTRFGALLLNDKGLKSANAIKDGLRAMALGREALWYKGVTFDLDRLLRCPSGKVPLIVVNLCQVSPPDRPWVVSQILHSAMNWSMSKGSSPARPRLSVLVDELAGDPSNVLLPPGNIRQHSSGEAIRRVLRQGRSFGATLLAGAQSAGDIDYKSFSQFAVRIIGRLQTRADVDKCTFGLNGSGAMRLSSFLAEATAGKLFVVPPNGEWECVRMRMLGCVHADVTREDLARLYQQGFLKKMVQDMGPSRLDRCCAQLTAIMHEYGDELPPDVSTHLRQALMSMGAKDDVEDLAKTA